MECFLMQLNEYVIEKYWFSKELEGGNGTVRQSRKPKEILD